MIAPSGAAPTAYRPAASASTPARQAVSTASGYRRRMASGAVAATVSSTETASGARFAGMSSRPARCTPRAAATVAAASSRSHREGCGGEDAGPGGLIASRPRPAPSGGGDLPITLGAAGPGHIGLQYRVRSTGSPHRGGRPPPAPSLQGQIKLPQSPIQSTSEAKWSRSKPSEPTRRIPVSVVPGKGGGRFGPAWVLVPHRDDGGHDGDGRRREQRWEGSPLDERRTERDGERDRAEHRRAGGRRDPAEQVVGSAGLNGGDTGDQGPRQTQSDQDTADDH